ncbi:hypothetical protein GCM10028803_15830 [Larkinella knui]|uniref:Uncharacterized protein n=1 Tax=Larkinella knui TaxID=2025310 RepID=A0A3P1C9G5_9BACT|nr:hypothetical protein [Larkinella knui]RRB09952.1 hypothetical protein EHT87_31020 [Larkinella knui]
MDFDPTEFIRTLGSIASISSAYLAWKKAFIDGTVGKRDQDSKLPKGQLPQEVKQQILRFSIRAGSVNPSDFRALQALSSDIFETATERLKQTHQRFVQVIAHGELAQIEEEESITRHEMCSILALILRHNGNKFPPDAELEKFWKMFRCTPLYPEFGIRTF